MGVYWISGDGFRLMVNVFLKARQP